MWPLSLWLQTHLLMIGLKKVYIYIYTYNIYRWTGPRNIFKCSLIMHICSLSSNSGSEIFNFILSKEEIFKIRKKRPKPGRDKYVNSYIYIYIYMFI